VVILPCCLPIAWPLPAGKLPAGTRGVRRKESHVLQPWEKVKV
jgi:hypothetical protein